MVTKKGTLSVVNVTDPVFRSEIAADQDGVRGFRSDYPAGFIGCTEQYELRNPVNGRSSGLTSSLHLHASANGLGWNSMQNTTRLQFITQDPNDMGTIARLGSSQILQANRFVFGGVLYGLKSKQWEEEVKTWFRTSLANLQNKAVRLAGAPWANRGSYTATPVSSQESVLCSHMLTQK